MPLLASALLALLAIPAEVGWEVVEECPGILELERGVEGWIGAGEPRGEGVRARGRIRASAGGYRLDLVIEQGSRAQDHVLLGHDCAELADLAALLIASAVDPFVLGEPFESIEAIVVVPMPEPVAEPESALAREPVEPRIPDTPVLPELVADPPERDASFEFGPLERVAEPERPRIRGFLVVSGVGAVGLFQRPNGGVELLAGIDRGALRVGVGAAGWFGGRFRSDEGDVGGNLQAGSGMLELCGVPSVERANLGFPLCAVGTVGAIVGTGVGIPDPATVVRPWAAAGGDVGLRWRLRPRVALRLGVGVLASLVRPVWEVAGPVVRFTTPPVMGRIRLGLDFSLGPL